MSRTDLERALLADGFRGTLRKVRVAGRSESGRVIRLALDGLSPPEISGQDLRLAVGRALGWQRIQSTAFQLREKDGAFRFEGRGYGHGVGMCVIGSARLARSGTKAADILKRYFPGARIEAFNAQVGAARTTGETSHSSRPR